MLYRDTDLLVEIDVALGLYVNPLHHIFHTEYNVLIKTGQNNLSESCGLNQ